MTNGLPSSLPTSHEPGLYFAPESKGIGIRIEDDILVTERGRENLSEGIPSDPDVIEAIIGG